MKSNKQKFGYSTITANEYISKKEAIYCLSTELEPQPKFINSKPTNEIVAYKAWFSQKSLPPFTVKFESKIDLPNYLQIIQFEDLKACEIGYNVYFKASGIKMI